MQIISLEASWPNLTEYELNLHEFLSFFFLFLGNVCDEKLMPIFINKFQISRLIDLIAAFGAAQLGGIFAISPSTLLPPSSHPLKMEGLGMTLEVSGLRFDWTTFSFDFPFIFPSFFLHFSFIFPSFSLHFPFIFPRLISAFIIWNFIFSEWIFWPIIEQSSTRNSWPNWAQSDLDNFSPCYSCRLGLLERLMLICIPAGHGWPYLHSEGRLGFHRCQLASLLRWGVQVAPLAAISPH